MARALSPSVEPCASWSPSSLTLLAFCLVSTFYTINKKNVCIYRSYEPWLRWIPSHHFERENLSQYEWTPKLFWMLLLCLSSNFLLTENPLSGSAFPCGNSFCFFLIQLKPNYPNASISSFHLHQEGLSAEKEAHSPLVRVHSIAAFLRYIKDGKYFDDRLITRSQEWLLL